METQISEPKKVFISLPLKGRSEDEYTPDLERAKEAIAKIADEKGWDYEIIDSIAKDFDPNTPREYYLKRSINLLITADIVYFCNGFSQMAGCKYKKRKNGKRTIKI